MRLRHAAAFTLFEVLGVMLVTALLLGVAVDFYLDLSHQAVRATDHTRELRRATSILDRIAGDLEHTLLLRKPSEMDPLAHPWVFVAESRLAGAAYDVPGADRVKFVQRRTPRGTEGASSDLVQIAYVLEPSQEGDGFELRRWLRPGLPESLDRDFPLPGDPDALMLADDIEHFALRFLDEAGRWHESWDSSQLVDSGELPSAVEIEVALLPAPGGEERERLAEEEPRLWVRQVHLPMRPIDLEAMLEAEAEADAYGDGAAGEEGDGPTIAECVDFSQVSPSSVTGAGLTASDLEALAAKADVTPFAPYASLFAGLPVNAGCL